MIRQVSIRGFDKNLSYFIFDQSSKELIIVDPGDSELLIAEIEIDNLIPKAILLTHSHSDHLEGVFGLVEKYNIPVYINKNGIEILSKMGIAAREVPINIRLGDFDINCIHTPGHTDDSVCYYIPKLDSIITGDTMFVGSVGNTSSVGAMKQLYKSISFLRKLPPKTIIFPGHDYGKRPVALLISERKCNEFLKARNFFMFSKLFKV